MLIYVIIILGSENSSHLKDKTMKCISSDRCTRQKHLVIKQKILTYEILQFREYSLMKIHVHTYCRKDT